MTVMKITPQPRFFRYVGNAGSIRFTIGVKPYLRLKKGNVYTSCLFLAEEFRQ